MYKTYLELILFELVGTFLCIFFIVSISSYLYENLLPNVLQRCSGGGRILIVRIFLRMVEGFYAHSIDRCIPSFL